MNSSMGTTRHLADGADLFLRRPDLSKMPQVLVFVGIHEDFLDDCNFKLDWWDATLAHWVSLPESRHGSSGVISYQDGSAEIHRWKDPRTLQPVTGQYRNILGVTGSPDWRYLKDRYTRGPRGGGGP